jgi:hypothetical protein
LLAANSAGVIMDDSVLTALVITCPQPLNMRVAVIGKIKENEFFMYGLS